jgi:hypothetical protein
MRKDPKFPTLYKIQMGFSLKAQDQQLWLLEKVGLSKLHLE